MVAAILGCNLACSACSGNLFRKEDELLKNKFLLSWKPPEIWLRHFSIVT